MIGIRLLQETVTVILQMSENAHMYTIVDLIQIKLNDADADFWVTRRGAVSEVGKPSKTYSKEAYGIKVLKTDILLPQYLYYVVEHLNASGKFRQGVQGSTQLVTISRDEVYGLIAKFFQDRGA